MFLGDYFQNIQSTYKKFFFSGISFDSTQIKKDNIFFAIKGRKNNGNKFVSEAFNKKASIAIVNKINKRNFFFFIALIFLINNIYISIG